MTPSCPAPDLSSHALTQNVAGIALFAMAVCAFFIWCDDGFTSSDSVRKPWTRGTWDRRVLIALGVLAACYSFQAVEDQMATSVHDMGACFVVESTWDPGMVCAGVALMLFVAAARRHRQIGVIKLMGLVFTRPARSLRQLGMIFVGISAGLLVSTFAANPLTVVSVSMAAAVLPWMFDAYRSGEVVAVEELGDADDSTDPEETSKRTS